MVGSVFANLHLCITIHHKAIRKTNLATCWTTRQSRYQIHMRINARLEEGMSMLGCLSYLFLFFTDTVVWWHRTTGRVMVRYNVFEEAEY